MLLKKPVISHATNCASPHGEAKGKKKGTTSKGRKIPDEEEINILKTSKTGKRHRRAPTRTGGERTAWEED